MSTHDDYIAQNRTAWNAIATVREQAMWPGAEFFAAGGSLLDERVLAAAGDLRGQSLLHLQCATGEETLSWAVAGAAAVGVDLSEAQIVLAEQKAQAAGLSVRFVASDLYALPADLQAATFNVVYTGGGVLVWLPDIVRWAEVIAAALAPGGTLLLFEEHPVAQTLWAEHGQIVMTGDYFGRDRPEYSQGWSHFVGGEDATETKAEFAWPLGDVVTALIRAGLQIRSLTEYPSDADWRFGEHLTTARRLPGQFLLVATKEQAQ